MVCWASILRGSTMWLRLNNGWRQPGIRQGFEAVNSTGKSPWTLMKPSTSRRMLKSSTSSCCRRSLEFHLENNFFSCVGVPKYKEVCQSLHEAYHSPYLKWKSSNLSCNLVVVKKCSIESSRHQSRQIRNENYIYDTQLQTSYASPRGHSSNPFKPFISSPFCSRTNIFSCASHFDIPKATQISRFSSKPAEEPAAQHAPKDDPNTSSTADVQPKTKPSALSQEPRPKGIVGYIIFRYTWYIERLQRSLETEMPRTFRMFRIFSVGLKAFIKDFTGYVRVLVKLSFPSERLEGLTLHQLQLYHFMPYDMFKVFPVLAISAIPFGQNLALPLGYLFPRQLLCRHFWDLQQSHDFAMRDLRKRVQYARPVFRCLQASVAGIEPLSERVRMQSVCHLLGSGRHPRDAQVTEIRELFSAAPYGIKNIKRHHVHSLLRLHGLRALLSRKRLRDHARWLLCHDWALTAEACGVPPADTSTLRRRAETAASSAERTLILEQCDLASLHVNVLKTSLLLRGISPIGLDSSGMAEVLERWLAVSLQLSSQDSSLLLHLPILLFYNHPTNLALVSR